ncbi:hypothetical protein [Caudoviricetes sp.]|nr:hypothetical protein [Caudoviricetes sp.]
MWTRMRQAAWYYSYRWERVLLMVRRLPGRVRSKVSIAIALARAERRIKRALKEEGIKIRR